METKLWISLRFILEKRKSFLMSLTGTVFGVTFFIVTQAQTAGFERFFIETIIATNGALRIQDKYQDTIRSLSADSQNSDSGFNISMRRGKRYISGIQYPKRVAEAILEFRNVTAVSEVVTGNVEINTGQKKHGGEIYGINLQDHLEVSRLASQIVFGSLNDFRNDAAGVLIGRRLAERLLTEVGDSLALTAADQSRRFKISAIYETGVSDIDKVRLFLHQPGARSLLKRPFGASFLQVNLADIDRAPQDAEHMSSVIGHLTVSWQEREKTWLEAFKFLRISAAITVFTIILISGLGMFNTLAIIVMEKSREIAILRSIGYTREDVSSIFLLQGLLILVLGTILGWLCAAGLTFAISRIPIHIRGIFSTDYFPVYWSAAHYIAAAAIAFIVVLTASYLPARKAARFEPAEIIRGTAI